MFSSDQLRFWLNYAETVRAPLRIPLTGPRSREVRCVSVHFNLDGEDYLFERIEGDSVYCKLWDGFVFTGEHQLSLFDVWRSTPLAVQYWEGFEFRFTDWASFAREQTWRARLLWDRFGQVIWKIRGAAHRFRKDVAIERFAVLATVRALQVEKAMPGEMEVSRRLLGEHWLRFADGLGQHARVKLMLDALVDLNELKLINYRYKVTGTGIAALSQYEEEERKHKESLGLQKGIRWLTVIMAGAALLQAKVIDFKPLFTLKGPWPWQ